MLTIRQEDVDEMIAHALEDDPNECCGILGGNGDEVKRLYRATNLEKSPYRYRMEPLDQLNADKDCDENGWEFMAFYHSHTHSPAYPSATDVRMALQNGWLNVHYVLVSLMNRSSPDVRAFRIGQQGEIAEEEFRIE